MYRDTSSVDCAPRELTHAIGDKGRLCLDIGFCLVMGYV